MEGYEHIIEELTELVCRFRLDGTLTYVNEGYCRYYGIERANLSGTMHLAFIHPEDQHKICTRDLIPMLRAPLDSMQYRVRMPGSGPVRWQQWSYKALPRAADSERYVEYLGVGRDISEQKTTELQLQNAQADLERRVAERTARLAETVEELRKEADERQKALKQVRHERDLAQSYLDIARVIFVIIGMDRRVRMINRMGCEILGYAESEIVGRDWFTNFIPEEIRERLMEGFSTLLNEVPGGFEYFENPVLTKSGRRRIIAWSNTILFDERGRVDATLSSGTDITERVRFEAEAVRAERLSSLGKLSAGVAHDIKNPVTSIIGYAQILSDESPAGSEARDISRRIIKEAERISGIVNSLLSFAREGGAGKGSHDIRDIVRDILYFADAQLKRDRIEFRLEIADGLPRVLVNPQQLQQVMLNLIDNARDSLNEKFTSLPGAKTMTLKVFETIGNDTPHICIEVIDNGKGIASAEIGRVFEHFYTTKPPGRGTGLGLSICRDIVAAHGGVIEARSQEGEYARMRVMLPVDEGDEG